MRKPLEVQTKHLTKEEIKKKQLEEESVFVGNEQLEHLPNWLINDTAKNEWTRLVKEFNKKSMISNLDYNNLGAYCNAFAKYTNLTKEVGLEFMVGMDVNPLVQLELKYSEEMKKFGNLLGLSIESRLKIGTAKGENLNVNLENQFGEI